MPSNSAPDEETAVAFSNVVQPQEVVFNSLSPNPTWEDCIPYLELVKTTLSNEPQLFHEFNATMKEFQNKSISLTGTVQKISTLFKNYPQLLIGFNTFLPADLKVPIPSMAPESLMHSVNFITKVKTRFQENPEKYTKFLSILCSHRKKLRGGNPSEVKQVEENVLNQISTHVFNNDPDLLEEFKLFICNERPTTVQTYIKRPQTKVHKPAEVSQKLKRKSVSSSQGIKKKIKSTSFKDVSLAEASRYGSIDDFEFLDSVRKACNSQDVYNNFLNSINLLNNNVMTRVELLQHVSPFLARFPNLLQWLKKLLGFTPTSRFDFSATSSEILIDLNMCHRTGVSYRILPPHYEPPKCSGRTALCKEVLNDSWVLYPSWSEDSESPTSHKTIYEENMFRCEDERFELDLVIEINATTLRVLEAIQKKMSRMPPDEAQNMKLNDSLGGASATVHMVALKRIYGEKAADMFEGLKDNPVVAIPVVLRRLKAKEEEWRNAQREFNKIWREETEKNYIKSLDHQGITFRQTDVKRLRSKNLLNDIETIVDEQMQNLKKPHLVYFYEDKSVLEDAAKLLLHQISLVGADNDDKLKMKEHICHFIPDLFFMPRININNEDAGKFEVKPRDGEEYNLFIANDNWYIFFRLHQILCERLYKIKKQSAILAVQEPTEKYLTKELTEIDVDDLYQHFLKLVNKLLDNNIDITVYEDTLRNIFGIHAYVAFTLDKVVANAVKQLVQIVTDEAPQQCVGMFYEERKRDGGGGLASTSSLRAPFELAYQKRFEEALDDENCFQICVYKYNCKITFEWLIVDNEEEFETPAEKLTNYIEDYVSTMRHNPSTSNQTLMIKNMPRPETPVFLPRNVRLLKKKTRETELSRLFTRDDTECRFDVESYKMVFVANKGDLLFKKNCFTRARAIHPKITKKMNKKFKQWHDFWLNENVTKAETKQCTDWLMGKKSDYIQNKTRIHRCHNMLKPPYGSYNRYTVEYYD